MFDVLLCCLARLEPAGSHGVWGLDDYQFLPFIWGSSQLNGHLTLTPSSIHTQSVLDTNAADYLYLGFIKFVKQVRLVWPSTDVCNGTTGN